MKRLDIGWVTPAQKPKFALSTYSRNILVSAFVVALLVSAAAGQSNLTNSAPTSAAELLDRFTIATKAKDEAGVRSLVCWDGVHDISAEIINNNISELLSRQISTVELQPLQDLRAVTNNIDRGGFRWAPNIPFVGEIHVRREPGRNSLHFYYGKKNGSFFIGTIVAEKPGV